MVAGTDFNSVDIVSITCIGVLWIISIFSFCWFWSFVLQRKKTEIASRRPKSSIIVGALSIIGMGIQMPLVLILYNVSFVQYFPKALVLTNILSIFCQSGAIQILTYRAYMIYYDINWNLAMTDQKWRLHIDADENNWFLRHRDGFLGNTKKVGLLFFIHWLIWLIAAVILSFISRHMARTALAGPGVISIICDLILFVKFPKFDDLFAVSSEIKLALLIETIGVTSYYIIVGVVSPEWKTAEYALIAIVVIFVQFGLIITIYVYPLKKFNFAICPCNVKSKLESRVNIKDSDVDLELDHVVKRSNYQIFTEIVGTKQGFNSFARHLTREFCLENFLFFVETQQWLHALITDPFYAKLAESDDYRSDLLSIELSDSAPKSNIIKVEAKGTMKKLGSLSLFTEPSADEDMEIKDEPSVEEYIQCLKLFQKYVPVNEAHFCINISFTDRQTLYQAFGCTDNMKFTSSFKPKSYVDNDLSQLQKINFSKEILFHIFDDARVSIYRLLMQSLGRFRSTEDFFKLQEQLQNGISKRSAV